MYIFCRIKMCILQISILQNKVLKNIKCTFLKINSNFQICFYFKRSNVRLNVTPKRIFGRTCLFLFFRVPVPFLISPGHPPLH